MKPTAANNKSEPKRWTENQRKAAEPRERWNATYSLKACKQRIAEIAEAYELKAGELERRILLDALETAFYERSLLREQFWLERQKRQEAERLEREANEREREQQERAALPVCERTYGHLRLIKSA